MEDAPYDFSFSGVKSAVLNHLNKCRMTGEPIVEADIAASFQQAVVDVLVDNAIRAAKDYHMDRLAIAGGVASNGALRAAMEAACEKEGIRFYRPSPIFCTDNAAMIGVLFENVGIQCLFLGAAENALEAAVNILQDAGMEKNVCISLSFEEIRLGIAGDQSRSAVAAFGMNGDFSGFLKEKAGEYGASLLISGDAASRIPGFFSQYHPRRLGTFFLKQTETEVPVYEVLDGEPEVWRRRKLFTEEIFEAGLRAFEEREYLKARMAFICVLKENPGDGAAVRYVRLCEDNLKQPPHRQTVYMETYGSRSRSI